MIRNARLVEPETGQVDRRRFALTPGGTMLEPERIASGYRTSHTVPRR